MGGNGKKYTLIGQDSVLKTLKHLYANATFPLKVG